MSDETAPKPADEPEEGQKPTPASEEPAQKKAETEQASESAPADDSAQTPAETEPVLESEEPKPDPTTPEPSEVDEPTQLAGESAATQADEQATQVLGPEAVAAAKEQSGGGGAAEPASTPEPEADATQQIDLDPEKTVVQPAGTMPAAETPTQVAATPPISAGPPTQQQGPLYPPGGTPAAAPTGGKKRRTGMVVGAIIGAIVIIGCFSGGWLLYQNMSEERDHKVGKCIKQVDDERAKPVKCSDDDAYKIFKRINDTTDEGKCPSAKTELVFINESDEYVLCLQKAN